MTETLYDYINVIYVNNVKTLQKVGATNSIQDALNYAVINADLDTVKHLVDIGANVQDNNHTALQNATLIKSPKYGNLEIIEYLIKQGCNVDVIKDTAHPIVRKWLKTNFPKLAIKTYF